MVLNNFICQICAVQFDIRRNVIVTESPISNSNSQVPRQEGWIGAVAESGNGPQARTCRVSGEVLFTGYDGATISAAELKGINQARFLVPKPSFAAPPPDETDYERVSDVFVTSLTTISSDWSSSWHFVPRYGIMGYNVHAENHLAGYDQFRGWRGVGGRSRQSVCGVPVHDACWKVFMKVCEAKLGAVDLQGFYALWEREACAECGFQNLQQEPCTRQCRGRRFSWTHNPGTEFLCANPIEIPDLIAEILPYFTDYPEGNLALEYVDSDPLRDCLATDPFNRLPVELRQMILCYLSSADIASLQRISRSFRLLTKSLFKRLLQEEKPWFWELENLERLYENPPFYMAPCFLSKNQKKQDINWLNVWSGLQHLQQQMHGIRNRARIWKLAEEIVARIGRLRASLDGAELLIQPSHAARQELHELTFDRCINCRTHPG